MTEKLFETQSHRKEFQAAVLSCTPHDRMPCGCGLSQSGYQVVLDRTAFFPEGGGQAADTGMLGGVRVQDVQERDGVIYHMTDGSLKPGSKVEGMIDWEIRFSRMQQHTGEHIVSGLIHSRFGYDNVGFHLGEEVCTLDLNGPVTKEQLKEIEFAANEAVFANLPVEISYPSKEELAAMDYRSKIEIEGQVRIVSIPGYDVCACCAPHVERTGEIGLIKFTHMQNYKGGVRITMVCGLRALRDYQAKEESVKAIMLSLSAKEEKIAEAVERVKDEIAILKQELVSERAKVLGFIAEQIPKGQRMVCLFEAELSGNAPRELMNLVLDRDTDVCAVFSGKEEEGFRYVIGSRTEDVRLLCKELNAVFAGRGGGKSGMVQGSLKGEKERIRQYCEEFGRKTGKLCK